MNRAADLGSDRFDEPWTARYEDLRQEVLETGSGPMRLGRGRALVVRRGVVTWMQAWPRQASSTLPESRATTPTVLPLPSLPSLLRPQLVQILVTTILSNRPEVFR